MYADEALYKLDKFLTESYTAGYIQVRIIHGKGTGALRQAVRNALHRHPLVKSYRAGQYGEGEAGVTVVQLSER
ncbi:MAG: MutS2 family protein [Dehalococcoidia bacterium]|nr:MutS2 family protein [Dehalococcoidia bacterium]